LKLNIKRKARTEVKDSRERPTAETSDESRPPSPCIRHCTLDDNNVCLGCLRTLDEIIAWSGMSAAAQRALLRELAERRR
jgi:uncharacterized protein